MAKCAVSECPATVKDHYWGRVKAEGWFFTRNGKAAYCPEHVPDWVAGWRARKAEKDD